MPRPVSEYDSRKQPLPNKPPGVAFILDGSSCEQTIGTQRASVESLRTCLGSLEYPYLHPDQDLDRQTPESQATADDGQTPASSFIPKSWLCTILRVMQAFVKQQSFCEKLGACGCLMRPEKRSKDGRVGREKKVGRLSLAYIGVILGLYWGYGDYIVVILGL